MNQIIDNETTADADDSQSQPSSSMNSTAAPRDDTSGLMNRLKEQGRRLLSRLDPLIPAPIRYVLAASFAFGYGMTSVSGGLVRTARNVKGGVVNIGNVVKSNASQLGSAASDVHKTIYRGATSVTTTVKDVAKVGIDDVRNVGKDVVKVIKHTKHAAAASVSPCVQCGNTVNIKTAVTACDM